MAVVLMPNKMIANGNQAIDGRVCSPVISEPTAERSGAIRETSAPMTAPITTARPNPITARSAVVPMACHSRPVCSWPQRSARVPPGPGKISFFQPRRWMSCHTASTMATASTLGHRAAQPRTSRRRPRCSVGDSTSWASSQASRSA